MAFNVFYGALDGFFYNNAQIGQVTGANNQGTVNPSVGANKIAMPPQFTDPRLNAFANGAGDPCVDLANRGGITGVPGNGTHWILGPTISGTSLPDNGAMGAALNVVANPYASVLFKDFVYFIDYDTAAIYAATAAIAPGATVSLAANGNPAYQFTWQLDEEEEDMVKVGIDLEVIGGKLYGLFASYTLINGSFTYQPSVVLRLDQTGTGARLDCQEPDRDEDDPLIIIANNDFCFVGKNAVGMSHGSDERTTTVKNYLLVACIGGQQNAGSGNGTNSMVSLVDVNNYVALNSPILGTFVEATGGPALDIKAVAVTPPASATVGEIAKGDCYVFVMASSYNSSWQTDFRVGQTKLSTLIAAANNSTPLNMGNLTRVDSDDNVAGYFWTVAFAPEDDGCVGTLVVGRGNSDSGYASTGDLLNFYPVGTAGFNTTGRKPTDSAALYGAAGCVLNSITLVPAAPGTKALRMRTLRAAMPAPVASGMTSMADFLAGFKKKKEKK